MKNKVLIIFTIVFIAVFSIIFSLTFGGSINSCSHVLNIIFNKLFNVPLIDGINKSQVAIIWDIRMPRVFLSFLIGGMLSISGCIFQSVLRNTLASSYTLGVSSGSSLGMGLLIISGLSVSSHFVYSFTGFLFSIITVMLVLFLSRKIDKNLENNTVILVGMVISLFLNSILNLLTSIKRESISSIVIWQMGSFSSRGWGYVMSIIPIFIITFIYILTLSRELDILTFGDEMSKSVGVNLRSVKIKLLLVSSVLTGASISSSGIIGFIDLITPQISRKIFGGRHIVIIPISMVLGGTFMVWFDFIARNIVYPSELPLSTINALVGTPIFCYILFKKARR